MTDAIPTKFCIVINTTKFSLWVIPKFAPSKLADGRHLEKRINCYMSAMVPPIITKYCVLAQIGIQTLNTVQKITVLKIQDGGRPPFGKILNAISQQSFDQF